MGDRYLAVWRPMPEVQPVMMQVRWGRGVRGGRPGTCMLVTRWKRVSVATHSTLAIQLSHPRPPIATTPLNPTRSSKSLNRSLARCLPAGLASPFHVFPNLMRGNNKRIPKELLRRVPTTEQRREEERKKCGGGQDAAADLCWQQNATPVLGALHIMPMVERPSISIHRSIILQETKSSVFQPFTQRPKFKGCCNFKCLFFEEGGWLLKEVWIGQDWKSKSIFFIQTSVIDKNLAVRYEGLFWARNKGGCSFEFGF